MRVWILGLALLAPAFSTAQTDRLPADLNGTWLLKNDQGQPSYIAFSDGNMAIYRGRLSTVALNASRRHADAAAEVAEIEAFLADDTRAEQLTDRAAQMFVDRLDLPEMDETAKAEGTSEVSASIRQRLQERLERQLIRLRDAAAKGDGTLTQLDLNFTYPGELLNEFDRRRADIAVSGDRLYLTIRKRVWIYDRTSALTGEARAEWDRRGRRGFEYYLANEYDRLFYRCVRLERDDQPVEDCRAYRDRMADFGVELRPEFVLERYRDFDKPGEIEMAFWKNQLPGRVNSSATFPELGYCFDGRSTGETREAFMDRLAADRFRNTLWRLQIISSSPGEKPRNWTQEEYIAWAPEWGRSFGSVQGPAFLRADGVLGFSKGFEGIAFDPRNRWSYENGEIRLSWYDGAFEARIPVQSNGPSRGKTTFVLGKDIRLELVLGSYDLLAAMVHPESHPDYERLLPYAQSATCDSVSLSSAVAETALNPEPDIEWPTREPDAFPTHWFGRTDMSDGSEHPDAKIWEGMQRGGFFHLNDNGVIGVNIERPAGYGYDKSARWNVEGRTLTLSWSTSDTFVFELPASYDTEISAVGQKNPQYRLVLTPADLLEPGTRRRAAVRKSTEQASAPSPDAVAALPAEVPTAAPPAESESPAPPKASLAGCWRWSNGARITLMEDGTAVNGIFRGSWRSLSTGYVIQWPPIEDTLTVSGDGDRFDGKGFFDIPFSGTRMTAGDGLTGQWRRQDGVVLDFRTDGSVTAGSLRGRWTQQAPSRYTVSWPVRDVVSMSDDGERLTIVNQFGKATATRGSGC